MKRTQLKKLSLAYAMALCCQPLLGMEEQNQFPVSNSTDGKVDTQGKQKRQMQEAKKLARMEMNVHKMLLLKESVNNMDFPKDVSNIIMWNLHDVTHTNPVLDGELTYTLANGKKATFNIKDLVTTDGCIDLSDEIFGDVSKYFLITTDLEQFFSIEKNSRKIVMLIAPRFLIGEKIESSAKPFAPIMDNWKEAQAPIGMFWRKEYWENGEYDYLTSKNVTEISSSNLFKNWKCALSTHPPDHHIATSPIHHAHALYFFDPFHFYMFIL